MTEMMSAGEFSEASGVSPKALRLYAESGLLCPAFINESNGYRYYTTSQLEAATTILLLRGAEVSLAEIRRFLEEPTPDQLGRWEYELRSDAKLRSECLNEVRRRFGWSPQSKGEAMAEIREITTSEELAEVFTMLGRFFAPQFDSSDRRFGDLQQRLQEDHKLMTVATLDGERVGGCLAFRTSDEAVTLRIIAVVPDRRRQGIGRALVRHLEETVVSEGAASISLGADDAIGFWFRLGYTPMLLLQWAFDPALFEAERDALLDGPLRGLDYSESAFNGVPQLIVKLDEPRMDLRDATRNSVAGCHVGFCLTKDFSRTPA